MKRYYKYVRLLKSVLTRKPLLLGRMVKNYCLTSLGNKRLLRKVEIGVSFDCQCACAKCSSAKLKSSNKEKLTLAEYKDVSGQLIALGAVHINFTGGESLLASDLIDIVRSFSPKKMLISINTNALLLTPERIDGLEAAGVDIIKVSLDSPVREEHDVSRGVPGSFDRVIAALEYIKTHKRIQGHISTVSTRELLRSGKIWEIVNIAQRYRAFLGITVPTLSGKWQEHPEVLLEDPDRKILAEVCRVGHVIRDVETGYKARVCPAGKEEIYVTCYGDVIPCPFIQISFGNIRDMAVSEVWQRMQAAGYGRDKGFAGCLAGEDPDFISSVLKNLQDYDELPVPFEDLKKDVV